MFHNMVYSINLPPLSILSDSLIIRGGYIRAKIYATTRSLITNYKIVQFTLVLYSRLFFKYFTGLIKSIRYKKLQLKSLNLSFEKKLWSNPFTC